MVWFHHSSVVSEPTFFQLIGHQLKFNKEHKMNKNKLINKQRWQQDDWIAIWKHFQQAKLQDRDPRSTIKNLLQCETDQRYENFLETTDGYSSARTLFIKGFIEFIEVELDRKVTHKAVVKMMDKIIKNDPTIFGHWLPVIDSSRNQRASLQQIKKSQPTRKRKGKNSGQAGRTLWNPEIEHQTQNEWQIGGEKWYLNRASQLVTNPEPFWDVEAEQTSAKKLITENWSKIQNQLKFEGTKQELLNRLQKVQGRTESEKFQEIIQQLEMEQLLSTFE
jgi:hypothetical protein